MRLKEILQDWFTNGGLRLWSNRKIYVCGQFRIVYDKNLN